jgi:hypothetical protein
MKRTIAFSLLLVSATAFGGGFNWGNLVVVTVGTGVTINNSATAGALREYSLGGGLVQTLNLPTASGAALTFSGSATSEGFLKLSTDGNYLTLAGYDAIPGTAGPQVALASAVNRVVGVVQVSTGNIDISTKLNNDYNLSNIRGAVSTDGNSLWTSGNGGTGQGGSAGTRYMTLGSTTGTQLHSAASNIRVADIYMGQLYVTSSTSSGGGLYGVSTVGIGLPTSAVPAGQPVALPGMPTSGTHSAYDFFFKDANTLYIADDGAATAGGGIQKWGFDGSTWSLQYTLLNNGTTTTGIRGLTGTVDGSGNTLLFGTTAATSANSLIEVIDTGVNTMAFTTIATAESGYVFRGVSRIPEPSGFALAGLGLLVLAAYRRLRR